MPQLTIGQKVLYRGALGTNIPRLCTITGKGEKNDRTVYDNSLGHWGYAYQYELVLVQAAHISAPPSPSPKGNDRHDSR